MKNAMRILALMALGMSAGWAFGQTPSSGTATVTIVAAKTPVAVVVTPATQSLTLGAVGTLSASVTATSGPAPTGTVSFYDNFVSPPALIATEPLVGGVATCTLATAGVALGTYTVTGTYNGDSFHY